MYTESEGLVLSALKYNDTNDIVEVFTRRHGRVSFIVARSRGKRGGVRSVLFRPLSQLRLTWAERGRGGLRRIKAAEVARPYTSLPYEPVKSAVGLFLGEFLHRTLRHEEADEALYEYVGAALDWYDMAAEGHANFHIVFLMRMTRFLGFFPNIEGYAPGSCFDLIAGSFTGIAPTHRHFVPTGEAGLLPMLMRMTFDTMHLFRFTRSERNRLLDLLIEYYRLHTADFPELKSVSVLRELFA